MIKSTLEPGSALRELSKERTKYRTSPVIRLRKFALTMLIITCITLIVLSVILIVYLDKRLGIFSPQEEISKSETTTYKVLKEETIGIPKKATPPLEPPRDVCYIDNGDPETSNSIEWNVANNADYSYTGYGSTFAYMKHPGATYTIEKELEYERTAKIYMMWRAFERCPDARVVIYDDNKILKKLVINQNLAGDRFNFIYASKFKKSIKVVLISQSDCKTCFDALKIEFDGSGERKSNWRIIGNQTYWIEAKTYTKIFWDPVDVEVEYEYKIRSLEKDLYVARGKTKDSWIEFTFPEIGYYNIEVRYIDNKEIPVHEMKGFYIEGPGDRIFKRWMK